ncbi:MAG: hypothetical protein AAFV78_19995 [Bacteroidota bacterium]
MSKKELDFDKLGLGQKKPIKRSPSSIEKAEKAVQSIHKASPSEPIKRVTIDFPISTYKQIRMKTLEEEMTLKAYFLHLVKQDLED